MVRPIIRITRVPRRSGAGMPNDRTPRSPRSETPPAPSTASSASNRTARQPDTLVSNRMEGMSESGVSTTDVQFSIGRFFGPAKIFGAHKSVLSSASDVFHNMLNGSQPATGDGPIDIPDILPEAFANMLRYIYADAQNVAIKDAFPTMMCADKYGLPLLVDKCFNLVLDDLSAKTGDANRYLLHLDNALTWAVGIGNVVETCLHFVDVHCVEIFKSELFIELQPTTLQMILERKTLFVEESVIYVAVNRWAAAACTRNKLYPTPQNRRQVLGDILSLIRFPLMTVTQLVDGPLKDTLLLPSDFTDICRHKEYLTNHPLRFSTEPRRSPVICVGDWEFQHKEEVFANEMDYWCPAVVIGARGSEVVCKTLETGKEDLVNRRPETIIRAADYLEYYEPILHGSRGFHEEATYIKMKDAQHIILVAGIKRQVQFSEILLKHTQTTAWISTMEKDNRKVHIVPMRKRID